MSVSACEDDSEVVCDATDVSAADLQRGLSPWALFDVRARENRVSADRGNPCSSYNSNVTAYQGFPSAVLSRLLSQPDYKRDGHS